MARFLRTVGIPLVSLAASLLGACAASQGESSGSEVAHLTGAQCAAAVAWAPNTPYSAGEDVEYGGKVYQCVQAHTSQASWTPDAVAALWEPTDCAPGAAGGGTSGGGTSGGNPCVPDAGTGTGSGSGTGTGTGGGAGGGAGGGTPDAGTTPPPVSGNPGGPSNGSLPKHLVTGYWQDFDNGAKALKLSDVPSSYSLIAVAFANADASNPGGVTFSVDSGLSSALGGYSDAQFTSDIQALHGQGRKVIVSVGGQNGAISVSDATSASNFANSVYGMIQKYGFDGVDIDLENGIDPTNMGAALHQLASKVGSNLIVTLAPQTIDMQSTQGGYFQLALNIKDILTIVNMQYYNSGSMLGADGKVYSEGSVDFLTALAAIQLQGGLRPDQVGLGLPATTSGAGSGYVSPSVVNDALDCLANGSNCGSFKPSATYPTIRGAMDWSISWDAQGGYSFANTVSGHFGSL